MTKTEDLRKRIYEFFEKNGRKKTFQHFQDEQIARSTIHDILDRKAHGVSAERRKGSGRVTKKIPKSKRKRPAQYFDHQTGKSQRVAARKFGITQAYVCQILQAKGVRCRKKEKKS